MSAVGDARKRAAEVASETRPILTLAEADALVGDDIAYWLSNPFMTPDLLAEKVRWWITVARTVPDA